MNDNKMNLENKLADYIAELESITERINNSGFPFSDSALIYGEVASKLRKLMAE